MSVDQGKIFVNFPCSNDIESSLRMNCPIKSPLYEKRVLSYGNSNSTD